MNNLLAAPYALSILRIFTGLSLLQHGTGKILGFPVVPSFANVQIGSLAGVGGLIEFVGGILFTIGLFTRPVAFIPALRPSPTSWCTPARAFIRY
jgi:putative oxidoreductase